MDEAKKALIGILVGAAWGALVAAIKIVYNKQRTLNNKQKALNNGVLSLLRADIIRSYDKYTEREYCPIYARDALEKEYNAYHELGGNGTITKLWEELQELPTERR